MDYFDHLAKTPNTVSLQNAKDIVQACFAFPSITSRSAAEDCIYSSPTAYLLGDNDTTTNNNNGSRPRRDYAGAMEFCIAGFANIDDPAEAWQDEESVQTCIGGVGGQAAKDHLHQDDFGVVEAICRKDMPASATENSRLPIIFFEYALDYYATSQGLYQVPEALCDNIDLDTFRVKCLKFAGLRE